MELSSKGKQLLEYALTKRAWTLEKLSKKSDIGIATVKKFSARKSIGRTTFVDLCNLLEIDWEVASGKGIKLVGESRDNPLMPPLSDNNTAFNSCDFLVSPLDEDFIDQVRERCRQKILEQHSRMYLLSGQEIDVDQLYVDVWLLEKPESKYFNTPDSLLDNFDIENDRLALGKRIQRNPGFETADNNSKLIILGKPGSGKTTFLKQLAINWCRGKFQSEKIATLIELRNVNVQEEAKERKKTKLLYDSLEEFFLKTKDILGKNAINMFELLREDDIQKTRNKGQSPEDKKQQLKLLYTSFKESILKTKEILNKDVTELLKEKNIRKLEKRGRVLIDILDQEFSVRIDRFLDLLEKESLQRRKRKRWNLVNIISEQLELSSERILNLLEQGRILLLMDGLDEISTDEIRRDLQIQVNQIAREYSKGNRIILTCRTQIIKKAPTGFTSVEVADFNPKQVRNFVWKWFTANRYSESEIKEQWGKIQASITDQPDLKELTATPVLLSLMCLVLQDQGEISTNRGWLYSKGINLLLSRWNDDKEIEGWEVGTETYRKLSIDNKEELLAEIAAYKFKNPKNFVLFEQDEIVKQISRKLKLSKSKEGLSVLKAIEAQHGLLVERADELWSFSHLTFQEHFTFRWLTRLPTQKLAEKIADQQWQKVVEQLVKSQQPADRLLRLINRATNQFIVQEVTIQNFLAWLCEKSKSVNRNYRFVAIRVFYYVLTCDHILNLDHVLELDCFLDFVRSLDRNFACLFDFIRILDLFHGNVRRLDFIQVLDHTFDHDHALELACDRALDRVLDHAHALSHAYHLERALKLDYAFEIFLSYPLYSSSNLVPHVFQLKEELPKFSRTEDIQNWWSVHGKQWIKKLRKVMLEHRNIGHNWQFTDNQKKQLKHYYEVNKFIVELMKIEGAVTNECRTEIEENLLLPWAELQRRQPHLYGELEP
ncbi:MAG: NACHT domain-containing protein [Cyanobacteria bacterium P01_G01_bin.54]